MDKFDMMQILYSISQLFKKEYYIYFNMNDLEIKN